MCSCLKVLAKCWLLIVNGILLVGGVALLALSIWLLADQQSFSHLLGTETFLISCALVTCLGFLSVVIAICGFCGVMKKSRGLLGAYVGLLCVVFLAQIVIAILILIYQEEVIDYIDEQLYETMIHFYGHDDHDWLTDLIDSLQEDNECCGSNSPVDWVYSGHYKITGELPPSCCLDNVNECGESFPVDVSDLYTTGCVTAMQEWMKMNLLVIGILALLFGLFQIFCIVFACALRSSEEFEDDDIGSSKRSKDLAYV